MVSRQTLRAMTVIILPVLLGFGPCGPISGGQLEGRVVTEKVSDFRFVQDVEHCALEVSAANEDAHSVTVNCWSVGKQLFIGCQDCEGKKWSGIIVVEPNARVRIDNKLYPVLATRMQDPGAIKRAWGYRWDKYEEGETEPVPEGYWLFHMRSTGRS